MYFILPMYSTRPVCAAVTLSWQRKRKVYWCRSQRCTQGGKLLRIDYVLGLFVKFRDSYYYYYKRVQRLRRYIYLLLQSVQRLRRYAIIIFNVN